MGTMTARPGQRNPFIFTLALSAQETAVVLARDLVSMAFEQWGMGDLDYNARLVMSEHATNAVRACKPDGEVTARVYLREDGRGLFIVDHLVLEFSVLLVKGMQGKVVRAVM